MQNMENVKVHQKMQTVTIITVQSDKYLFVKYATNQHTKDLHNELFSYEPFITDAI